MKDSFKKSALKLILGGIGLFAFGIFVGYQLDSNSISSLQGFLFNSLGDASATDPNATDANATDANATDANATDANAGTGYPQTSDNILYLQNFSLKTASAKAGEKVKVDIETTGACNSGVSIIFKNLSNGSTFTVSVNLDTYDKYIILPANVGAATYLVTDVLLVGTNSDNTTFTKQYSSASGSIGNVTHYDFVAQLKVVADAVLDNTIQTKLNLNSISLNSAEAKVNEKVFVKFVTSTPLTSLKLKFVNENSKEMLVYVKSLTNNPYFEVPSSSVIGTYNLVAATLASSTKTVLYSKDGTVSGSEKFLFNSSLVIKDNKPDNNFVYNNEDLTEEIITKLFDADSKSIININAGSNPIISSDLFNVIKGTTKKLVINYNDNQIIFEGKDVNSSKSIDVTLNTGVIKNDSNIGKLVNDGIVLDFASNGNLPGKALIRIKITEEMKAKFGNEKVHVYFYNLQCKDFSKVAAEVTATKDGYYEFGINHNSEYILVNKALDNKLIADDTDNVVSFQKSNKVYLLLIGLGLLVIVGVTAGIIIIEKKNKNKKLTKLNKNNINNSSGKDKL
ncbi:MAG: hypothetical protein RRY22_05620 [Bacilli bacterium]